MIYLAGSCASEQRTLMMNIAKHLRDSGKDVYCPFELKIENAWNYSQEEWSQLVFEADKTAIDKCDIFLMITSGRIAFACLYTAHGRMRSPCFLGRPPFAFEWLVQSGEAHINATC